jgi:hypothetical protein
MLDLQLSYSNFCALQFKFLEKKPSQSRQAELVLTLGAPELCYATSARHTVRAPRGTPWARTLRHPCDRRFPSPCTDVHAPNAPSPRAARPRAEQTASRRPPLAIGQPLRPLPPSHSWVPPSPLPTYFSPLPQTPRCVT